MSAELVCDLTVSPTGSGAGSLGPPVWSCRVVMILPRGGSTVGGGEVMRALASELNAGLHRNT